MTARKSGATRAWSPAQTYSVSGDPCDPSDPCDGCPSRSRRPSCAVIEASATTMRTNTVASRAGYLKVGSISLLPRLRSISTGRRYGAVGGCDQFPDASLVVKCWLPAGDRLGPPRVTCDGRLAHRPRLPLWDVCCRCANWRAHQ